VTDRLVTGHMCLSADSHSRRDLQAISFTHEGEISTVMIDILKNLMLPKEQ